MKITIKKTPGKLEFYIFNNNINIICNYTYINNILHAIYIINETEYKLLEFKHNLKITEDEYHHRLLINELSSYLRRLSNTIYNYP